MLSNLSIYIDYFKLRYIFRMKMATFAYIFNINWKKSWYSQLNSYINFSLLTICQINFMRCIDFSLLPFFFFVVLFIILSHDFILLMHLNFSIFFLFQSIVYLFLKQEHAFINNESLKPKSCHNMRHSKILDFFVCMNEPGKRHFFCTLSILKTLIDLHGPVSAELWQFFQWARSAEKNGWACRLIQN